MLNREPVKIPTIQGKINLKKQNGIVYVRYLVGRTYDADIQNNTPNWVNIGRRIEEMPTLMYPNDNYEKLFGEEGEEPEEEMTAEEERYARDNATYGTYYPFFIALYNEFKQQARKMGLEPVGTYKAERINKVLRPMKEMMKDQEYAELLGLINEPTGDNGDETKGMNHGDVMILLTQYKSALRKYRRF